MGDETIIKQAMKDNPDLPCEFIESALVAAKEAANGELERRD